LMASQVQPARQAPRGKQALKVLQESRERRGLQVLRAQPAHKDRLASPVRTASRERQGLLDPRVLLDPRELKERKAPLVSQAYVAILAPPARKERRGSTV